MWDRSKCAVNTHLCLLEANRESLISDLRGLDNESERRTSHPRWLLEEHDNEQRIACGQEVQLSCDAGLAASSKLILNRQVTVLSSVMFKAGQG